MRRPRCPKSAAIASKTSAEAKPLPSVNGPPRPTFETGAANGLKGKLFGYPDIPKLMDMTMRNFVLLLFICDESLNLHDFDDVFVDVTMSCCLSSCHRKTLADICHSKMPKRGNGIDGWNWTFNWFRFKDSNIFRWLEDQKKKVFPCLGELCELISPPSGSLLEKKRNILSFLTCIPWAISYTITFHETCWTYNSNFVLDTKYSCKSDDSPQNLQKSSFLDPPPNPSGRHLPPPLQPLKSSRTSICSASTSKVWVMSENANLKRSAYLHTRMPWRFGVSLKGPFGGVHYKMVFTGCRPNSNFLSENHPKSSPKAKKVVLKSYQHRPQTVKTIQERKLPLFSTLIGKSGFKERFLLENFRADKRIVAQKLVQFFQSHDPTPLLWKGLPKPVPSHVQARQTACKPMG